MSSSLQGGSRSGRREAWPLVLAALFAGMGAVALATFWIELPPGAGAREHPTYAGLLRGGAASLSHAGLVGPAWLFGALMLAAFGALLMRPAMRHGPGAGALWILIATAALQLAFAGLVLSYVRGMDGPGGPGSTDGLWGPFPAPTTWMLLIFYPSQLLFVIPYVAGFRRWFWTEDDEARFEGIAREGRSGAGD